MSLRRWTAVGIGLVALTALGWAYETSRHAVSLARGFSSGHMCSGTFLSGRDTASVQRSEIEGLHALTSRLTKPFASRHRSQAWVPEALAVPQRTAIYRECCGCILLPPGATEPPAALPAEPTHVFDPGLRDAAWPVGDQHEREPDSCVQEVLEGAFRQPGTHTTGALVVHRGEIVAERYANGFGPTTALRTWSTAKSLTSALVGAAVQRGVLELDEPVGNAAWEPDDPRQAITVRHLLHMSSGLESPGDLTVDAYWGGVDSAALAAAAPLASEPGTRFRYSNYDTLLLVRALRERLGDEAYWSFLRETLLEPLGMHHTVAEIDPYGNFILSSQVYTTPRDLARFALLYLADGVWDGERILPEDWVAFTRTPAPASQTLPPEDRAHAGYGAQFWLLGRDPALPDDTYTTSGARGQHATLVPSRDLVVVRMGLDPLGRNRAWDQAGFVADVLACLPPPA